MKGDLLRLKFPTPERQHGPDSMFSNAKQFSEHPWMKFGVSYYGNCPPGQFSVPVFFTGCYLTLYRSIKSILSHISKVKMGGIHAQLIITARTIMQHVLAFRNRTSIQNPRSSVCCFVSASLTPSSNFPIRPLSCCCPQPARFGLFYLVPESFCKGFRKTLRSQIGRCNLWTHNQFVWLCRALGCANTVRAFSLCPMNMKGQE